MADDKLHHENRERVHCAALLSVMNTTIQWNATVYEQIEYYLLTGNTYRTVIQARCQHLVQPSSSKAKADQGSSPFQNRLYTGRVIPVGTGLYICKQCSIKMNFCKSDNSQVKLNTCIEEDIDLKMFFLNVVMVLVILAAVEAHYYYKQKKSDEKPKRSTCNAVADIIFVYDTSGSIGNPNDPTNFNIMKEFMINIVDLFNPVGATGTQFAALCFSSVPKTHFYLNENNNEPDPKQATKDDIQAFPTGPNQNTAMGDALQAVRTEFLTQANGIGRPCAQCFVILITDGVSASGTANPVVEADKLRTEKNCIVYVVSIGLPNNPQMVAVAGSQANVLSVKNFDQLNTIVQTIVQAACSSSACSK
ncbi:COL6A [Mytilus coruscus]|uniref:COL6A n=1 Tax=Mytilus coruscus TaxID=42192 RepID=A0A6J8D628_MYTCO|nr:COL6A [Mytilus coruscus]